MTTRTEPLAAPVPAPRSARGAVGRTTRAALRLVGHSDVAIVYVVVLVGVTVVLLAMGGHAYDHAVEQSSTNLANLRERPWAVLLFSAFVVSSPWGLWLLPFLALIYATCQRWVGRIGTLVVAAVGHVGATLVVATGLSAGIAHGDLKRASVLHEIDVGVSYGLVCAAAFITMRVPRRWRALYLVVLVAYVVLPLVIDPTFTSAGHTVALTLGFLLALLVARATKAARR